jgi:two-component system copper resistance phosphate regulon response regulator CusR
MRLLIVEDDPEMADALRRGFEEERFDVVCVSDGAGALLHVALEAFAVIILDVMLPGPDGFAVCRALRAELNATPILMVTARGLVDDRVRGLDAGADDYLTKPFAFRELLARVHALARRQPALLPEVVRVEDLEVDLRAHFIRRAGTDIHLTAKEFALLELFVRHPGEVLGRAVITTWVWDDNHEPFANALEVLVRRLRMKIDEGYTPQLIHTARGVGYRFGT